MSKYQKLEVACGGSLNPETLKSIGERIAGGYVEDDEIVRQYREFMYDARLMLAPLGLSRERKLEMCLIYILEKLADIPACQSESAEDAIRDDIRDRIHQACWS